MAVPATVKPKLDAPPEAISPHGEAEFETKDEPVAALLTEIELAKAEISAALTDLDTDTLANSYPINVLGYDMTIQYFLMHLYGHFNYHLGQISYHRRLLDRAV